MKFIPAKKILEGLMSVGWSQVRIAKEVQASQSTISRIVAGKISPGKDTYDALLEMYAKEARRFEILRAEFLSITEQES